MSEDQGRQVPYHRSGGGQRVVVGGIGLGAASALLAATAVEPVGNVIEIRQRDERARVTEGPLKPATVNTGRRAEKNAAALAKAQAKRDRRAAKKVAAASSNA